jgi:hypothetical protein
MKKFTAILIGLRNAFLGGNLASIPLMRHPYRYIDEVSTLLFYVKTLSGRGRVEQKNPHDFFSASGPQTIRVDTDYYYWGADPSYAKDIVTLCILTRLTGAIRIFEIGTYSGYSAYHFAMNSPDSAVVYSLDLPQDFSDAPFLKHTHTDQQHIECYKKRFSLISCG